MSESRDSRASDTMYSSESRDRRISDVTNTVESSRDARSASASDANSANSSVAQSSLGSARGEPSRGRFKLPELYVSESPRVAPTRKKSKRLSKSSSKRGLSKKRLTKSGERLAKSGADSVASGSNNNSSLIGRLIERKSVATDSPRRSNYPRRSLPPRLSSRPTSSRGLNRKSLRKGGKTAQSVFTLGRAPSERKFTSEHALDGLQIRPGDIEEEIHERRPEAAFSHAMRSSHFGADPGASIQFDASTSLNKKAAQQILVANRHVLPEGLTPHEHNFEKEKSEEQRKAPPTKFVESKTTGGFSKATEPNTPLGACTNSPLPKQTYEGMGNGTPGSTTRFTAKKTLSKTREAPYFMDLKEAELARGIRALMKALFLLMMAASGMLAGVTSTNLMTYTTRRSDESFLSYYPRMAAQFSILEVSLACTLVTAGVSLYVKGRMRTGGWLSLSQAARNRVYAIIIGYLCSLLCALAAAPIIDRMVYEEQNNKNWYQDSSKRSEVALQEWVALTSIQLVSNICGWMVAISEYAHFFKDKYTVS